MHVVSDESGSDDSDSDDILPDLGACSSDDDDDDDELASLATLGLLGGWLHLAGVPPASRRALTHLCVVLRLLRNSGYGTRCCSQHSPRATHSGCCSQSHLAVGTARSGYHPAEAFRV